MYANKPSVGFLPSPRRSVIIKWGETELSMLGHWPDKEIAKITYRTLTDVIKKRESLGLSAPKKS